MRIAYLRTKDVVLIHFMVMKKYGGGEQAGIKDQGLLESAIYRPQQTAFEKDAYPTVFEKAAALFESLARNHCFYNGNKRTALASLDIFLKKNGYKLKKNTPGNEEYTVVVAQGKGGTITDITGWLEAHTSKYQN
ncbi:type II toxin-antitoxin system death-on-curing family toxin [Halobacillus sp. A5]|uniref:type II toxin-antitoxin system death-on-curing family toxin n=1 Tax=Halobacillus sp. A5 TaxID=2880263 RepID=UPI0020A6D0A5|nr:type II toxin-antitoxin system death-on-curing family toxin [Halobacillus sp. A5]MCP3029621.1 type II toxin-antitoxin system death-on-curing family toxin [Halobacillus sp. A5]